MVITNTIPKRVIYVSRMIDIIMAIVLIAFTMPLFIALWIKITWQYGKCIEHVHIYGINNKIISLYQFTGNSRFKQIPQLLNLLIGDISVLGDRIYFNFEPAPNLIIKSGLMSFYSINEIMGINFEAKNKTMEQACKSVTAYCCALMRSCSIYLLLMFMTNNPKQAVPKISLFGIDLINIKMQELINRIITFAKEPTKTVHQLAFVNADCFNISIHNPHYRQCLQECQQVYADGIGVRITTMWKGVALQDNLNGTDMFPHLCEQLAAQKLPLFLLGGTSGVANDAAINMQKQYPNLIIAGTQDGFYHQENSATHDEIINKINQSGAAVLLVAMGVPTQELWIQKFQSQLNVGVAIGVGGLFDFYSESIKRAPLWVRQLGMEWVYRLIQEPKRMWKRYIIGNPLFLVRAWKELSLIRHGQQFINNKAQRTLLKQEQSIIDFDFNPKKAQARRLRHQTVQQLNRLNKRTLDIIVSSTALILFSPVFVIIALLIRLESPGKVLFSQQRAGKDNQPFILWKFRSMYQDADERLKTLNNEIQGGVIFKMKQDPRITFIGKIIRKTSIDELPQLWNVLKGEMSIVGPRPALPSEVERYNLRHRTRLSIKPGITCIWQVSGRSHIPFERQVDLDTDYIYKQSLLADLWLMIKTIPAVIFSRGAY
ncbi:WecB/TagA/CpsF family glycosyltransferase [Shewanella surugensis]|uniref:WecB/TagA/CpsF family glycosyltransferase n=1 Tax=Shewanella surugensis TaxID=212020 RepID=A0ABT0LB56_9GAMM|nr:WecB/TagA/CpsF family glycosyltransferase [Shewanella surugensis]MCL1124904.1 WecB/TagA/CpsF family glycosyltransferase [Shewanella surugensis]